jgi:hypothetical protein
MQSDLHKELTPRQEEGLRWVAKQALRESNTMHCPDPVQLVAFSEQTLEAVKRVELQSHLRSCPVCAGTVIDMMAVLAPVMELHHAGMGWRGPVLALRKKLAPETREDWDHHCEQCVRCKRRSDLLVSCFSGVAIRRESFAFAAGIAACALCWATVGRVQTLHTEGGAQQLGTVVVPKSVDTTSTPANAGNSGGNVTRTSDPGGDVPWLNASKMLQAYLQPTDAQLPAVIGYWEQSAKDYPGDMSAQAALAHLYARSARQATSSDRRKALQSRADKAEKLLQQLVKEEKGAGHETP